MNPGSSYRPGREIARGGMGAVLDARDQKLGRSVAMKVMLVRRAGEEEQQRFLQEARVLGQLAHPNIVPVHDVGTDEQGRLFYTMKLVVGVTLHDVIGKLKAGDKDTLAKYPLNALLTIFQKVCDAVAFAHSRGIIHRDLKPQNIMVGEFGEVLVMDWGLAKILPGSTAAEEAAKTLPLRGQLGQTGPTGTLPLNAPAAEEQATLVSGDDQATLASGTGNASAPKLAFGSQQPVPAAPSGVYATLEGAVMGTPHFMSPEQAEGKIAELDARSDIFSLGGILYALLTLRPPVEGESLEEILSKVRSGTIAPPTAFNAPSSTTQGTATATGAVTEPRKIHPLPHCPDGKVPTALSAVTMKALTRDKARRYQTVAEFTQDIAAYQGGFATSAENANALTLLRLFIHRHRALTAAASVVVLLTIGFMAKVISSEKKATANAEQAEANAKTAREHEVQAKANAKTAEENAAKAKAAEAAAVEKGEAARQALAKSALNLAEAALREGDGAAMQAALGDVPDDLRDSTWNYLFEQSDSSIARVRTGTTDIQGVAAHPRRPGVFAVADGSDKITLLEVRTGTRLLEFKPGKIFNGSLRLAFSPDGERIAIGSVWGGVVIHDARDGKKLLAWESPETQRLEFSPDGKLLLTTSGGQIHLWDAHEGRLAWSYPLEKGNFALGVFTADGQQIVTAEYKDNLRLVNSRDGTLIRALPRSRNPVSALAMHPDGTVTAVGERGMALRIDLRNDRVLADFRASDRRIGHVALTPDGRRIVTAVSLPDGRQDIRLWDANTGAPVQTLLGGSGKAVQISVHPLSGELLVAGPNARAWSLTGSPEKWTLGGYFETRTAFVGSDDVIFVPGYNAGLLKLQAGTPTVMWKSPGYARQATVSADGRLAAFGSVNSVQPIILLRNPGGPAAEQIGTYQPKFTTQLLRLSPAGDRLAEAENGGMELIDTATGKKLVKLERKDVKRFWDLGWLDDQRLLGLVTAKADRGNPGAEEWIVVWDVTTGKILQTATNRSPMDVLAPAPDGRRFAEAGVDKHVRIRDATTLAVQQEFRAHDAPITALAWHPKQPILATTSADLSIRLWHLDTGRRLEELRGPLATPNALSFSPGGKRLACSAADGVTRIWEPKSLDDRPATPQETGGWEDLLAPLTPATVTHTGNGWRMDGGVLFSPPSQAVLPLPGNLSGTSYQVRVKLRELTPKQVFHVVLPVGDRMVGFDLDGFRGQYTGLVLVNGKLGKDLPGAVQGKQVKDSDQHDLEVTVRLAGPSAIITVTLDGQPLYEWAGQTTALSQYGKWTTPPGTLALGTIAADWVVYEVKVKRLEAGKK